MKKIEKEYVNKIVKDDINKITDMLEYQILLLSLTLRSIKKNTTKEIQSSNISAGIRARKGAYALIEYCKDFLTISREHDFLVKEYRKNLDTFKGSKQRENKIKKLIENYDKEMARREKFTSI